MLRRTILLGLSFFFVTAGAQDDHVNEIVEGTRRLENNYGCGGGELLACLISAGLECKSSGDDIGSMICSSTGRPVFKVYEREPTEWVVEVLWQRPSEQQH